MTDVAPAAGPAGTARPRSVLEEERDFFLRSLRDLEAERAVGDIDETDYQNLRDDYTARAAAVLRALDDLDRPPPALSASRDVAPDPGPAADDGPAHAAGEAAGSGGREQADGRRSRRRRPRLAAVGVAAAVAVGVTIWALVDSSGGRAPGGTVSGQAVGMQKIDQLLTAANAAIDKNDPVTAAKDFQQVLAVDPEEVDALTGEGWLLVETGQSKLVTQGLGQLQHAEQLDDSYGPAHLYRGIGLLSIDDNRDAVTELQWYLAHKPDPSLKAGVQQALAKAQAAVAAAPSTTAPSGETSAPTAPATTAP